MALIIECWLHQFIAKSRLELGMKISVLSDLHIEFKPFEPVVPDADLVVLAGEIHTRERGVKSTDQAFPCEVLYILGNHEFYGAISTGC